MRFRTSDEPGDVDEFDLAEYLVSTDTLYWPVAAYTWFIDEPPAPVWFSVGPAGALDGVRIMGFLSQGRSDLEGPAGPLHRVMRERFGWSDETLDRLLDLAAIAVEDDLGDSVVLRLEGELLKPKPASRPRVPYIEHAIIPWPWPDNPPEGDEGGAA